MLQGIVLIIIATLGTLLVNQFTRVPDLLLVLIYSCLYSVSIVLIVGFFWRMVASDPESLTSLLTNISGFRMLMAFVTMLSFYLLEDSKNLMPCFFVFMAFYILLLIHHTIFFAKVSNRS
jgi:hypothetical protein